MDKSGVFLDLGSIDNGDLDRSALLGCLSTWELHDHSSPAELAPRIRDASVVVTNKCVLGPTELEQAGKLELIVLSATGTNNIDLDAAREQGIAVCNIRDYCSDSLAQHVITLMLNLLTGQPAYLQRVRQGEWSRSEHFSLHDRTIRQAAGLCFAVVGYGALGRATAQLAQGLGMEVLVAERRGAEVRPGRTDFDEVLSRADVISLHCPLTDETRNLLGAAELDLMKDDALLINTARGGIVNEMALLEALHAGTLGGAAIDTLAVEPPPVDHPLLTANLPTLLLTPHNAWASRSARQAGLDQVAAVISAWLNGEAINRVA